MIIDRIRAFAACFILLGSTLGSTLVWADDYSEGSRLYKEGKRPEALQRLDAYLSDHPKDARARFLKGVILTEQNKTQDAIKVFTELTQEYPELPEPYNNLAVLYSSQNDYEKARKALEMAIRTHPSYAVAHENLGDIYATLATQAYDKALQLDSNNAAARKKLALIKELFPNRTAPTAAPAAAASAATAVVAAPAAAPQPKPAAEAPAEAKPEPSGAAAEKPAAAPPPAAKPAAKTNPDQTAVLKTLQAWTRAWSTSDADSYLAHYAPNFRTPNGESRSAWEAARRERLAKAKKIHVTTSSPRIKFTDNNHAVVTFRQSYSSDTLKAVGTKSLELVRSGDRWLILQELIDK